MASPTKKMPFDGKWNEIPNQSIGAITNNKMLDVDLDYNSSSMTIKNNMSSVKTNNNLFENSHSYYDDDNTHNNKYSSATRKTMTNKNK